LYAKGISLPLTLAVFGPFMILVSLAFIASGLFAFVATGIVCFIREPRV
jgi:hypothetical protein